MRCNAYELPKTEDWYPPRCGTQSEVHDSRFGASVEWILFSMRVHEDVCVDGDQGSSSKRSNRASRSVISTFGGAVPLTVGRSNSRGVLVRERGARRARKDSSTRAVRVIPSRDANALARASSRSSTFNVVLTAIWVNHTSNPDVWQPNAAQLRRQIFEHSRGSTKSLAFLFLMRAGDAATMLPISARDAAALHELSAAL